jgi:hypothetical protein
MDLFCSIADAGNGGEKTTMKARFTYTTVTPESAEQGDYADSGFWLPGEWRFSAEDYNREENDITSAREVIQYARERGICYVVGSWLESSGEIEDYGTCEEVTYALHIDGVTPSTYRRIVRAIIGNKA